MHCRNCHVQPERNQSHVFSTSLHNPNIPSRWGHFHGAFGLLALGLGVRVSGVILPLRGCKSQISTVHIKFGCLKQFRLQVKTTSQDSESPIALTSESSVGNGVDRVENDEACITITSVTVKPVLHRNCIANWRRMPFYSRLRRTYPPVS